MLRVLPVVLFASAFACTPATSVPDSGAGGGVGGGLPGPTVIDDDGGIAASGTRLKSRWQIADGGARQWLSFFDTERNFACEPYEAGGGPTVCAPLASTLTFTSSFADARCSTPARAADAFQCDGDEFFLVESEAPASQCVAPAVRLWRSTRSTGSTLYASGDAGVCGATPLPSPAAVFTASAPLPLASLVEFSTTQVQRGPLTARFYVSADGARLLAGLGLPAGGPVDPSPYPDGGGRFLPTVTTYADTSFRDYADPACATTPAAYGFALPCPIAGAETPLVRLFNVTPCSVSVAIHERGPLLSQDGGVWSKAEGGQCMPGSAEKRLFVLGPRVSDDTYPALKTMKVGQGRLRFLALVDAAGNVSQRQGTWRDEALGVTCQPLKASDDSLRCLPLELDGQLLDFEARWFADSACSRPLFEELVPSCGRPAPRYLLSRPRLASGSPDPCRGWTVFGIGARVQGAQVWVRDQGTGTCTMVPAPATPLLETAVLPPSAFEPFSVVVE